MADLKTVLDSEDADAIRSKTEALAQVSMKLGEAMYKAQQEAGGGGTPGDDAGGGPAGGARAGGEGVVDAEFEEVDDERKRSA
jgi:molecular chaperone DnaK